MIHIQQDPLSAFIGDQPVELLNFSNCLESEIRAPIPLLKLLRIKDYLPLLICELVLDDEFAIAEATRCNLYRGCAEDDIDLCISFGDKHGVWKSDIAIGAVYRKMIQSKRPSPPPGKLM